LQPAQVVVVKGSKQAELLTSLFSFEQAHLAGNCAEPVQRLLRKSSYAKKSS
jgi:hypothetical protein